MTATDGTTGWVDHAKNGIFSIRSGAVGCCTNLQVSIARQENILLLVSAFDHNADKPFKSRFNRLGLFKKPQAHVRRHLVISRSARVKFSSERPDYFAEAALVGGMDIFIVGLYLELNEIFRC